MNWLCVKTYEGISKSVALGCYNICAIDMDIQNIMWHFGVYTILIAGTKFAIKPNIQLKVYTESEKQIIYE